jgi:hypothetical protein
LSQRLRRRGALGGLCKKLRKVNRERLGKTVENIDGRVFFSSLETADVGAIDSRIKGEPFLREAPLHPESPQVPGH